MSKRISDDELRAAYVGRLEKAPTRRGPECPPPEALLSALRGEGAEVERLRVLDHALQCSACRPELALLHGVAGSDASAAGGSAAGSRGPRLDLRRFFPLAAAASVVLALGVYAIGRRGGDVVRAGGSDGATLIAPAVGQAVPAGAIVFAWHPVPGALRYTVEVSAAEGELLFSAESADTLLTAQLANVRPGRHHWWVRAHMEDGSERRSAASELEVR
jgi:hypothetical protein